MDPDLAALRQEYELGGLAEADAPADPLTLFAAWFAEAEGGGVHEPNAMVLATASTTGQPAARAVLLKGLSAAGFVFYTNQESRKGSDLAVNPLCALTFPWFELQRQVRVEGTASVAPRSDAEAYFATRPRESQLGAWASRQSSVVSSRAALDASYADVEARFAGTDVPCPPHWGGYVVAPRVVEFWQGRRGRMHDRLVYRLTGSGWAMERLAP
ncbi:MAG: pdxH [Marmoricola sp.]|jgi:pyridoxamine 5'-phosphate oxidase|nr:pdxH [Marmoricola sp.]